MSASKKDLDYLKDLTPDEFQMESLVHAANQMMKREMNKFILEQLSDEQIISLIKQLAVELKRRGKIK